VIVLDASMLIAHLDATNALHQRATALLADVSDESLAISPITAAEVLVGPVRASQLDRAVAALQVLDVVTVSLDDDAPVRLAVLRAGTELKLPDCCVLLAAETAHAGVATFDDRLAAAARQRGLTVLDP
jgi:predicted nucleic acid-binding protein